MNELGGRPRKYLETRPAPRRNAAKTAAVATVAAGGNARRIEPSIFAADRVGQVEIAADDAGQRLDNYLFRRAAGVPKSHVYRVIRDGELRVNAKRVAIDYRLVAGDVLRLPPMRVATPAEVRGRTERREAVVDFAVIHEDDDLLVIDKPAGVAVHGGSGISFGVIEQLRTARPQARFLELVHRLDRDTSGLLMIAKKRLALVKLHEDLREGRVEKRYLACAVGPWPEARRQVRLALVKFNLADGERRVKVAGRDSVDAQPAHTIFTRLESFDGDDGAFVLLDVELRTGRTHQIRVHLAHLGRPIVGDEKYGDFALNKKLARGAGPGKPGLNRMFLHAANLRLSHPRTGAPLEFGAPLPSACARFLDRLRLAPATP